MELFSQIRKTPIFSYETRNYGDFFQDVYPWNKFSHTNTVRSNNNVTWHNDRTAHDVRANYLYLLGINIPKDDNTVTNYIHHTDIMAKLTKQEIDLLKKRFFYTEFDDISKTYNKNHTESELHPIFDNGTIRFYESNTKVLKSASDNVFKALDRMKKKLYEVEQVTIRIESKALLCIPNKMGLHSRKVITKGIDSQRWLIKTYNFASSIEYLKYQHLFKEHRLSIKKIIDMGFDIEIIGMCRPLILDIDLSIEAGLKSIRMFLPRSVTHLKKIGLFGKEEHSIANSIEYAVSKGLSVRFLIEDAARIKLDILIKLYNIAINSGAFSIGFADTAGAILPPDMFNIIKAIKNVIKKPLSVHCHNDLGLATANSLMAVYAGSR